MKTTMHQSSFFWNSMLSEGRKDAIIKWYNNLSVQEQDMVDDLMNDARADGIYNEIEEA